MPLDFMHANHIGGQGGGFEPMRVNHMQFIITGLDGQNSSRDDVLTLAIASFPLPKRSVSSTEIGYMNETRKFPGRVSYENIPLVFHDYYDKDVAGILQRWFALVNDPVTGKNGLAANIKKTCYIRQYSPDGLGERLWRLEGAYPEMLDPGDCDQDGDGDVRINVTLSIDKFYPEFAGIKP